MISHTHTHFITVKYCTFKPYHWSRWINFNSWHRNLTFFQQPQKQNYWLIVSQEARNLTYRNPLLMDWLFLPEILDLRDIIYPNTSIFLKLWCVFSLAGVTAADIWASCTACSQCTPVLVWFYWTLFYF